MAHRATFSLIFTSYCLLYPNVVHGGLLWLIVPQCGFFCSGWCIVTYCRLAGLTYFGWLWLIIVLFYSLRLKVTWCGSLRIIFVYRGSFCFMVAHFVYLWTLYLVQVRASLLWLILGYYGLLRLILAHSGSLCFAVAHFFPFWLILAHCGSSRFILAHCGWIWLILAHCG